jgi:hypothetical protein
VERGEWREERGERSVERGAFTVAIFSQPVAMEDAAFVPRIFKLDEDAIGISHHGEILGIAQRDGVAISYGLSRTSPMTTRKHQEQCHEHSARKQDSMRPP